jgi:4-hydroxybenzoate polyprenyltransferase
MNVVAAPSPSLRTLLRLGRISNIPTVWTNVLAACVLAGGDLRLSKVALLMLAMTAFYIGGMYLNDYFDREIDARERPGRPIDAGEIGATAVAIIGFTLLAAGIGLMFPFGAAAVVSGALLAATIVLYDIWHKGNVFSPVIMGLCRALVYAGAGVAMGAGLPQALVLGAFALFAHVVGLTYAAKQESLNRIERLWPLAVLAVPLVLALPFLRDQATVVPSFLALLLADGVAVRLLAERTAPRAVPRAVSGLIAAICLVDALAIAVAGGGVWLVVICACGYPLTRLFQSVIPGT